MIDCSDYDGLRSKARGAIPLTWTNIDAAASRHDAAPAWDAGPWRGRRVRSELSEPSDPPQLRAHLRHEGEYGDIVRYVAPHRDDLDVEGTLVGGG